MTEISLSLLRKDDPPIGFTPPSGAIAHVHAIWRTE